MVNLNINTEKYESWSKETKILYDLFKKWYIWASYALYLIIYLYIDSLSQNEFCYNKINICIHDPTNNDKGQSCKKDPNITYPNNIIGVIVTAVFLIYLSNTLYTSFDSLFNKNYGSGSNVINGVFALFGDQSSEGGGAAARSDRPISDG